MATIIFRVSRIDDAKCIVICLSPILLHGTRCITWGRSGLPLVVHYRADLQSAHGFRCHDNKARTRNVSEYMLVLALRLVLQRLMERIKRFI